MSARPGIDADRGDKRVEQGPRILGAEVSLGLAVPDVALAITRSAIFRTASGPLSSSACPRAQGSASGKRGGNP